jgi:hypothetical protein
MKVIGLIAFVSSSYTSDPYEPYLYNAPNWCISEKLQQNSGAHPSTRDVVIRTYLNKGRLYFVAFGNHIITSGVKAAPLRQFQSTSYLA